MTDGGREFWGCRIRTPDYQGPSKVAKRPTRHLPGTREKLRIMTRRVARGESAFHPLDRPLPDSVRMLNFRVCPGTRPPNLRENYRRYIQALEGEGVVGDADCRIGSAD
jgi:hypothetical protein